MITDATLVPCSLLLLDNRSAKAPGRRVIADRGWSQRQRLIVADASRIEDWAGGSFPFGRLGGPGAQAPRLEAVRQPGTQAPYLSSHENHLSNLSVVGQNHRIKHFCPQPDSSSAVPRNRPSQTPVVRALARLDLVRIAISGTVQQPVLPKVEMGWQLHRTWATQRPCPITTPP